MRIAAPFLDLVRMLYAAATLGAGWVVFSRFLSVATGIIVPHVANADEARQIVEWVRFQPQPLPSC